MPARPLSEIVEAGWAEALAPVADRIAAMGDFLRAEIAAGRGYLPAGKNVLRAFTQPFADVRVLIVGQDPYPTPGHPVGLSFSVEPDVRPIPRSLQNIYRELGTDLGLPTPANGDLTPWSQHGVLLLNRVLTVAPGASAAHRGKGWEAVTDQAIRALVARRSPAGRDPLGPRRPDAAPDARRGAVHRVSPSQPHVGRPGLLRLAPVQPRQRPAGRAGRRARRLETHLTEVVSPRYHRHMAMTLRLTDEQDRSSAGSRRRPAHQQARGRRACDRGARPRACPWRGT